MNPDISAYNNQLKEDEKIICTQLAAIIDEHLSNAENKIWHKHPVWFLEGNPIVGYSKLKAGIRLMFWSGADFEEEKLTPSTGKFKDASMTYTAAEEINKEDILRWLEKSQKIQWDYKHIYKRKGKLVHLK